MASHPDLQTLREAHQRIRPHIHRTQVLRCASIDSDCGAIIAFKCENFQRAGAFKIRGAANAVLSLAGAGAANGVATHSSGNHGAALCLAANISGLSASVVMPSTSPAVKKAAVERYGGAITFCEPTMPAREAALEELIAQTGAVAIHPYDNDAIIAGQSTAAIELLEDAGALDMILCPVGGGGLISGTALAAHYLSPHTEVIGAEPQNADEAFRSLRSGKVESLDRSDTVADGLRATICERTFGVIREHVSQIVTVSEAEIIQAMRIIWERMKIIIEPSAAVAAAPLLFHKIDAREKRVGVILTGGNVDLGSLPF